MALPPKPVIPAAPTPPIRGEAPASFATKANAFVVWQAGLKPSMDATVNYLEAAVNLAEGDAVAAANSAVQAAGSAAQSGQFAQIAAANAHYKGLWANLSGPLAIPATVFHNGAFWALLSDVADVTAAEPSIDPVWVVAGGGIGLTLEGNPAPFVSQTVTYTITNFNSFAFYAVQASDGTVSISGDEITFTAPADVQTVVLTVFVDAVPFTFNVAISSNAVVTPTVSVTGSPTDVPERPTITTSAFATAVPGSDTHASTTWRIRRVSTGVVVHESVNNAVNLLSYQPPAGVLQTGTQYDFEATHIGATLGASATGSVRATTAANFNSYIPTPTATPANFGDALEGGFYAGMIWNEVTTSASAKTLGTGTHTFTVSTDMSATPLFYEGQTLEVRSRANPSNRFQGTVTGAIGTTLTLNVASITGSGTFSNWSVMARFRVVVAPKASGENASVTYKNANTAAPTACQTLNEGWRATEAMRLADTSTVYPAAHWARNLNIGGRNDWYLPARDELELCWRNLKPATNNNYTTADRPTAASFNYTRDGAFGDTANTHGTNNNTAPTGSAYTTTVPGRTAATAFRTGGTEAFEFGSVSYWSSTEYSASAAWIQSWHSSFPGRQYGSNKTNTSRARAVRRSII